MTNQHPITPPPELAGRIIDESETCIEMIRRAYQAGADQELEACCQALRVRGTRFRCMEARQTIEHLRAARRPKPPSLKEQALEALTAINSNFHVHEPDASIIRRALEALDD